VLAAVWDLVWAGLVTNDTFAALRFLGERRPRAAAGSARPPVRPGCRRPPRRRAGRARRRAGARRRRLRAAGGAPAPARPRGAAAPGGRWSLVRDLVREPVSSTERAHAWAATLLDRHAIVARETAGVEALGGGFGGIYSVLRSMEDAGRLRRGYFVEGLGGAQFTYPGIVDRLRRERDAPGTARRRAGRHGPGQPVGLAAAVAAARRRPTVQWRTVAHAAPRRAARSPAPSSVVLVDGEPAPLQIDRNGPPASAARLVRRSRRA
jgi:ATP-dependent helicase Lhr and Lhr-like helicase